MWWWLLLFSTPPLKKKREKFQIENFLLFLLFRKIKCILLIHNFFFSLPQSLSISLFIKNSSIKQKGRRRGEIMKF
jgi:hypothetical protein